MKSIILVGCGGAAGSIARYLLGRWVMQIAVDWRFPLGTFVVNIVGCMAIGALAGLATKDDYFPVEARLLLFTGIIGGFTTFSAFELETFTLLRSGELLIAGGNVLLSVGLGLFALYVGFSLFAQPA
jgi:CrcB protein